MLVTDMHSLVGMKVLTGRSEGFGKSIPLKGWAVETKLDQSYRLLQARAGARKNTAFILTRRTVVLMFGILSKYMS